jgi:hypothetical protein
MNVRSRRRAARRRAGGELVVRGEIDVRIDIRIARVHGSSNWEWWVRVDGRVFEGRCRTRADAVDRVARLVEDIVRG